MTTALDISTGIMDAWAEIRLELAALVVLSARRAGMDQGRRGEVAAFSASDISQAMTEGQSLLDAMDE